MVGGQKKFAFVEVALTRVGVGLISESTFSGVASVKRPIPLILFRVHVDRGRRVTHQLTWQPPR